MQEANKLRLVKLFFQLQLTNLTLALIYLRKKRTRRFETSSLIFSVEAIFSIRLV